MELFSIIISIVGILSSAGGFLAALGYFMQGRVKSKMDTVLLLKEEIDALKTKVQNQQEQIDELKRTNDERQARIEALYKENTEKNKKILEYMDIFKGRDPQMQSFLAIMTKYVETNTPLLSKIQEDVLPVIAELKEYLHKQVY